MNDINSDSDWKKAFMAGYFPPSADLNDTIMNGILFNQRQRRESKRKEKTIMLIYAGAISFALLILFFLKGLRAFTPDLQPSHFAEFGPGNEDLSVYYRMAILSLFFSLIAIGVYFVKSRRLRSG